MWTSCNFIDGVIPWMFEMKYLGVMFEQAPYFKLNLHSNYVGYIV